MFFFFIQTVFFHEIEFFFQIVRNQFHESYIFWFFWRFNKFIFFFIIYSITLFKVFLLLSSTLIAHTHQSIQSIFIFSFFFRQNHTQHYILWNIRDLWHMMCLVGTKNSQIYPAQFQKLTSCPWATFGLAQGPELLCFASVQ